MKEKVTVRVTEEVECFRDCWCYSTETHYTEDWTEEQVNDYDVEVEMDEDGNILTSNKEIEEALESVAAGNIIYFEVVY